MRYDWAEINPFADPVPASYIALHPFKRVPTLLHDGFALYETGAITRYVDETFEGPMLQPREPRDRARCNQIISIVDSYAYWPLVRQVFSHSVFRRLSGQPFDDAEIRRGLDVAPKILSALQKIAGQEQYLCDQHLSLADIYLAPMIGYFVRTSEGQQLLGNYARLSAWWLTVSQRIAYRTTTPQLPQASP